MDTVTDNNDQHCHTLKAVTDNTVTDNNVSYYQTLKAVTPDPCYQCGNIPKLLHIDTRWRNYRGMGAGLGRGGGYREAPMCEVCAEKERATGPRMYREETSCSHCDRDLVIIRISLRRYHSFCNDKCQHGYYNHLAKLKRDEERGTRDCDTCGDTFTPKRSDSKYCSSKCRQKAYRQRGAS